MIRRAAPAISDRALNRAALARQGLLARQPGGVEPMLRHLVGLQGQVHNAPYIALWSRLEAFAPADLEALLLDRRAVRAPLLRVTLHVAMAEDFLAIRPMLQAVALRAFRTNHLKHLKGADLEAVRAASRDLLAHEALTPQALGRLLGQRWPDVGPIDLSMPARFLEPVVHVPPAGLWGATGAPALTMAGHWLGRDPVEPLPLDELVLRYLRALGPATGTDFNTWSGLTGGGAAMERLRPRLVSFTGADGRELFDLPDAPRPDEHVSAPARLLADYDNMLVGHADRRRVLSPAHYGGLWRANGLRPAFTVDGMVRGSWKLTTQREAARLDFICFEPLSAREAAELEGEGEAMIAALLPGRRAEIVLSSFA